MTPERIAILEATPGWTWSANEPPKTPITDVIQHVTDDAPPERTRHPIPSPKDEKTEGHARTRSQLEEFHKRFKSMNAATYASTITAAEFTTYHSVADTHDARDPPERQPLTKMAALLAPFNKPSYHAVDLGCGINRLRTQPTISRMTWTSVDVHAADPSVTVADMAALPYEDESYDIATLGRSLWARNHMDVLREVHRILKVGGRAVICESFRRWLNDTGVNTLIDDLKAVGFEIIHEDGTCTTDEVADVFQYVVARKD